MKICKYPGCITILSKYNKRSKFCFMHQVKKILTEVKARKELKLEIQRRYNDKWRKRQKKIGQALKSANAS